MHHIIEFVKKHPLGVAGGVFIIGVLLLLVFSKSSATVSTGSTGNSSAAAELDYDIASLQASSQLQAQQAQINGQVQVASLAANTTNTQYTTALTAAEYADDSQLKLAQVNADAQANTTSATLQATLAQINAQAEANSQNFALAQQANQLSYNLQNNSINAQQAISQASINEAAQVAAQQTYLQGQQNLVLAQFAQNAKH